MTSRDLAAMLDHASAHVGEVDLAERAWAGAVAARRRRQRAAVAVGALAAAAATAVGSGALSPGDGGSTSHVTPATTSARDTTLRAADGTEFTIAPPLGAEAALPHVVSPLPEAVPDGKPDLTLSATHGFFGESAALVNAVMLTEVGAGRYQPVLFGTYGPRVLADKVTLQRVGDPAHGTAPPLSLGAVSPDGLRVAFPQRGAVVVLRVDTGVKTVVPVPDPVLTSADWSFDDAHVIARSQDASWSIDPVRRTATRLSTGFVASEHYQVVTRGNGVHLLTWSAAGRVTEDDVFSAPVTQAERTVSSLEGWAGASVYLFQEQLADSGVGIAYQALLAVNADVPSRHRMLVFGEQPPRSKGCCQVLGWSGPNLLYLARGDDDDISWVLSWNVNTREVSRGSMIRWFTGHYAPFALAIRP